MTWVQCLDPRCELHLICNEVEVLFIGSSDSQYSPDKIITTRFVAHLKAGSAGKTQRIIHNSFTYSYKC